MRMRRIQSFGFAAFFAYSAAAAQTNHPPASVNAGSSTKPVPKNAAAATPGATTTKSNVPAKSPAGTANASTAADDRLIGTIMDKFEAAVKSDNLTYPIEVMYTPVLNQMGGRDQLLAVARATQAQMKAQQVSYISWKAQRPYTYVNGKVHRYAIIRYEALFNTPGRKLKVQNCLLGIKVSNNTWQFLMGDQLSPEFNNQFLPDFPRTAVIPRPKTIQF